MQYSFEAAAKRGEEPSDDLNPAELLLHERLRTIYALLAMGRIDVESAKSQKELAEEKYREMQAVWTVTERLNEKNVKLWKHLERFSSEYRKHDREDLTGLVDLGDGMMPAVYYLQKWSD